MSKGWWFILYIFCMALISATFFKLKKHWKGPCWEWEGEEWSLWTKGRVLLITIDIHILLGPLSLRLGTELSLMQRDPKDLPSPNQWLPIKCLWCKKSPIHTQNQVQSIFFHKSKKEYTLDSLLFLLTLSVFNLKKKKKAQWSFTEKSSFSLTSLVSHIPASYFMLTGFSFRDSHVLFVFKPKLLSD